MRIIYNDNQMKSLLKMYGVPSDRQGRYNFCDIKKTIRLAFPNCWLQEYQSFPSPLGGNFGRWVIGDKILVRSSHHRKDLHGCLKAVSVVCKQYGVDTYTPRTI